jgi:hypothetical protein
MKKLSRELLIRGLLEIQLIEQPCGACLAGKQRRATFLAQAQFRAEKVLELVHDDLYGKISPLRQLVINSFFSW